jgi:dihydrofolate synthase/folylpolyglutamate synthase
VSSSKIQRPVTLHDWLSYIEQLHPANIELGLDRLKEVFARLNADFSNAKVITVAGTNGKGTTCAFVEQACLNAGKSVAVYSSPHIQDYRERLRLNGSMLSEKEHCQAFASIETLRQDTELTYFEFATLAALWLINQKPVEVILLEVGLGGRLDAVNIVDNDLAVITTVDLDHQDWLGDTREKIGFEKAGILRPKGDAIVGDLDPPQSVIARTETLNVNARWQNRDFSFKEGSGKWTWSHKTLGTFELPACKIPTQNASTALAVMDWLNLSLDEPTISRLCCETQLTGRLQKISSSPVIYVDVAHNPQATSHLAQQLRLLGVEDTHFVCGMLKDKDIKQTLLPLRDIRAIWHVASINEFRGAAADHVSSQLDSRQKVLEYSSVVEAYQHAVNVAKDNETIVVFGSFLTVAAVLDHVVK